MHILNNVLHIFGKCPTFFGMMFNFFWEMFNFFWEMSNFFWEMSNFFWEMSNFFWEMSNFFLRSLYLNKFRLKVRIDFDGKLKLNDFGDFGFTLPKDLKVIPFNKADNYEDEREIIEERFKNQHLEREFDQLKGIHKDLIIKCTTFFI